MKTEDRAALRAFDSKNNILLKVVGEGKERHLEAKKKSGWGRAWIQFKMSLGIPTGYSLEKVADYVAKSIKNKEEDFLRLNGPEDVKLLRKLDAKLLDYNKKQSNRYHEGPSLKPLTIGLKITDLDIKLNIIIKTHEDHYTKILNEQLNQIEIAKEHSKQREYFGLPENFSLKEAEKEKDKRLEHFNPKQFNLKSQKALAEKICSEINAFFEHLKELDKLR